MCDLEWKNAIKDILGMLREIQQDNKEIKGHVKQIKDDIKNNSDEILELHKKVQELETENQELKGKLLQAQKRNNNNNIIIFGIPETEQPDKFITNILKDNLEVDIQGTDINNIHRIGQHKANKHRPVILELVRNTKKQEIFRNINKLKGTGISISNDLVEEERKQQKLIYKHYKLAKEKQYQVKLLKNKLIINGEEYTYEHLKTTEDEENDPPIATTSRRANSDPGTPNQIYIKESQEIEQSPHSQNREKDKKKQEEKKTNTYGTPSRTFSSKTKAVNNTSKSQLSSQGVLTRKQLQTQSAN